MLNILHYTLYIIFTFTYCTCIFLNLPCFFISKFLSQRGDIFRKGSPPTPQDRICSKVARNFFHPLYFNWRRDVCVYTVSKKRL